MDHPAPPPDLLQIGAATREFLVGGDACPVLPGLGLSLCGISWAQPGFRFARTNWDSAQTMVTVAGEGRVLVDGAFVSSLPGMAYQTPCLQKHAYHADLGEWVVAWAIFMPGRASAVVDAQSPRLVNADGRSLQAAITALYHETTGANDALIIGRLAEAVAMLAQRCAGSRRHDPRLAAMWEDVRADLNQPWSLDGMARRAGMGAEQLRRYCRRDHGRTPAQHLTWLRLSHAADLLTAGRMTVAEVATVVGYCDGFAFSTAFKRVMGRPPSTLRQATQPPIPPAAPAPRQASPTARAGRRAAPGRPRA